MRVPISLKFKYQNEAKATEMRLAQLFYDLEFHSGCHLFLQTDTPLFNLVCQGTEMNLKNLSLGS